ncbi:MAG: filamentous hemagglutinin N-terminal domain-containing protein [Elainella sp. C42_A2020_010]|nr:filamentous hemagglutinin N-terminal domain-containing protein [Elainella sp. C42_A2020_010]
MIFSIGLFAFNPAAIAQITPDTTLGNEGSRVIRNVRIRDLESDRIDGGARRGANLFHSFEQFDVSEERGAYFTNPSGVRNIFSRVTGGNRSEILGQLGVIQAGSDSILGNANLFFMNPNGILFGRNSRLDVGGSFIGTTANAIQFGEDSFSANNPTVPSPLLTVNPSALLFNQITAQATDGIESRGFLSVPTDQSLLLVGGAAGPNLASRGVVISNSAVQAPNGQIEIVGFSGLGNLGLNYTNTVPYLGAFPQAAARSDVAVENSTLDVSGMEGGIIRIDAENLRLVASTLLSSPSQGNFSTEMPTFVQLDANQRLEIIKSEIGNLLLSNLSGGSSISIRAGSLAVRDSRLETSNLGAGRAGDITLLIRGEALIDGATTRLRAAASGNGDAGDIQIRARSLQVINAARLTTSTFGQGNAGNITATIAENLALEGSGPNRRGGGLFSSVERGANGNGGNIRVQARSLSVQGGAGILTRNNDGEGRAGNITLEINGTASFDGTSTDSNPIPSGVSSEVTDDASGDGGNITIWTGSLLVTNGAQLSTTTSGQGNAGRLVILARDRVIFDGINSNQAGSGAFTGINQLGAGKAGNLRISANALFVINGAQLSSGSLGRGNAGNVVISTGDRVVVRNGGTIFSNLGTRAVGRGGDVWITTGVLEISDGSQLRTDTFGRGPAGNVVIRAQDLVVLNGLTQEFSSSIFTIAAPVADGSGGNVEITTPLLRILNNSVINTSTANANRAGDIVISADVIQLVNGAQLVTTTLGDGRAGTIDLTADTVLLSGRNPAFRSRSSQARQDIIQDDGRSGLFASTGEDSSGNGGNITVNTIFLELDNGARISARSQGSGIAGNINVDANGMIVIADSDITTSAANSSGGSINLTSERIRLRGDGDIRTEVASDVGNGGDITLTADSVVAFDDSDILAFAGNQGGDITFNTPAGFFAGGRQAVAASSTANLDQNNQVNINADGRVAGTIALPDVSFIENSLSALTETAINTDQLLANSCIARTQQGGTFLITGTGGLPAAPGNDAASTYPTGEVRTIPTEAETDSNWQPGDPIVEPQGVYRLPDGRWVMSRECTNRRTQSEY